MKQRCMMSEKWGGDPAERLIGHHRMQMSFFVYIYVLLQLVISFPAESQDFNSIQPIALPPGELAGFASSDISSGENVFSQSSGDLNFANQMPFWEGKEIFRRDLVEWGNHLAFGKLKARNASSCVECHIGGGRSGIGLSLKQSPLGGVVAFVERNVTLAHGRLSGPSIQDVSGSGERQEGEVNVEWVEVKYSDMGVASFSLKKPIGKLSGTGAMVGLRVAPGLIGLGLIEAIPESDILQWHSNKKRGRPVWQDERGGSTGRKIGKFGWKAGHADVEGIVKSALVTEMGIPVEKVLSAGELEALLFYSREIGVPRRAANSVQTEEGFRIFDSIGCSVCHRPSYDVERKTSSGAQQIKIWPFSDFLVHDMGGGMSGPNLSGQATEREWRTSPLWGIGRSSVVLGHESYLHDGRATTLYEAIRWHGGEAEKERNAFQSLPEKQQTLLIQFLKSL